MSNECKDGSCEIHKPEEEGKVDSLFLYDYKEALQKAKDQNKIIMVDFITDWCGWCVELDKQTYSVPEVQTRLKQMVCVKVDAEKGEGPDLAKKYAVNSYPRIIFIDKNEEPIDVQGGFSPPDQFKLLLQNVLNNKETVPAIKLSIKENPNRYELYNLLSNKLLEFGKTEDIISYCKECIYLSKEKLAADDKENIWSIYSTLINVLDAEEAVKYDKERIELFPEFKDKKEAWVGEKYFEYGCNKLTEYISAEINEKQKDSPDIGSYYAYNLISKKPFNKFVNDTIGDYSLDKGFDIYAIAALSDLYYSEEKFQVAADLLKETFKKFSSAGLMNDNFVYALFRKMNALTKTMNELSDSIGEYNEAYQLVKGKNKDFEKAISMFTKVLEKEPIYYPALDLISESYSNDENPNLALDKALESAKKLNDLTSYSNIGHLATMARIYQKMKDKVNAKKYVEIALDLLPDNCKESNIANILKEIIS